MKKHTAEEADDMGLRIIRWAILFAVASILIYSTGVAFMVLSGIRPLDKNSSEFIFVLAGAGVGLLVVAALVRLSVILIGYFGLWISDAVKKP